MPNSEIDAEKQPPIDAKLADHEIVEQKHGDRPACFRHVWQEVLFVSSATMAIAMTAFLTGANLVIYAPMAKELNMSTAEITWINASSSYVQPLNSKE
jgi:hypothetical protein